MINATLRANADSHHGQLGASALVAHTLRGDGFDASEDGTGRGMPLLVAQCHGSNVGEMGTLKGESVSSGVPFIAIQERADCLSDAGPNGKGFREDGQAYTLEARSRPQAIAFTERGRSDGLSLEWQENQAYAMTNPAGGGRSQSRMICAESQVRRLTPRECERLQGFSDDYTLVPYRSKPASDGPRYRAIGNSMAVPVMRWLGERIESVAQVYPSAH